MNQPCESGISGTSTYNESEMNFRRCPVKRRPWGERLGDAGGRCLSAAPGECLEFPPERVGGREGRGKPGPLFSDICLCKTPLQIKQMKKDWRGNSKEAEKMSQSEREVTLMSGESELWFKVKRDNNVLSSLCVTVTPQEYCMCQVSSPFYAPLP